jgi:hypothetical protein
MKGNIRLPWLLLAAALLSGCGGKDSPTLTPVVTTELPPQFISYPDPNMFIQGEPIMPLVPTITGGTPTNYLVQPDLPAGLRIDYLGRIVGTPTVAAGPGTYIVTAGNSAGTTSFGVRITVAGRYTVGGVVFGLTGTGLVLTNNGTADLAISADGRFTFEGVFPAGYVFIVQVAAQPSGQTCTIAGGSGQIANVDYGDVVVTCGSSAPKLTRAAVTFTDAARDWSQRSERNGTQICLDVAQAEALLSGDAVFEFVALPGERMRQGCGPDAYPLDPEGLWLFVPDERTRVVRVFAVR